MLPLTFFRRGKLSRILIAATLLPGSASAITFNLFADDPGSFDPNALNGFIQAISIWDGLIADDFEMNLFIQFDGNDLSGNPMAPTTLGSTGRATSDHSYTAVRGALIANSTSAEDVIAVANLPAGTSLNFFTNNTSDSSVFFDNDNSTNNNTLSVSSANAKALGLLAPNNPGLDAGIAFNPAFSWDFDQTDGVGDGLQDFVGVTVHEIGHALGFVSGVDSVDRSHGSGPNAGTNLNDTAIVNPFDLFRYSGVGQLDMATGGAPYFSIDGGTTNLADFSTGAFNGDLRQASHWKDNELLGPPVPAPIGIHDPTAQPAGESNILTSLDLLALDVIGYEIVPEPSSALLTLLGMGFALRRKRS